MSSRTRVVLAGAVGNVVEWYDFGIYGLMAPTLASLFFPSSDRTAALLGVYGGFAVGFAMRPIGAIVLGRVGDLRGPRFVLLLSVALIGAATVAIGLLPTYRTVGMWAPLLLILLRLFQGFSVGGEFVGSVTYLVESAPPHRRGVAGSVANIGATVGMLLAAVAGALAERPAPSTVALWRLPFLLGGVMALAGFLLRRHLPDDAADEVRRREAASHAMTAPAERSRRWPVLEALRQIPRTMLTATLFTCGYGISNYLTMVFLPTFASEFAGARVGTALSANAAAQALVLFLIPLAGWISDFWLRRRTLLAIAFLVQAGLSWPLFRLIIHTGTPGLWAAQLLLAGLLAMVMGTAPAMLSEQFPREYRVSAHALVLNIGIGIAGGFAPMVAIALIRATSNLLAPAFFLSSAGLLSGVSALMLSNHGPERRDDL